MGLVAPGHRPLQVRLRGREVRTIGAWDLDSPRSGTGYRGRRLSSRPATRHRGAGARRADVRTGSGARDRASGRAPTEAPAGDGRTTRGWADGISARRPTMRPAGTPAVDVPGGDSVYQSLARGRLARSARLDGPRSLVRRRVPLVPGGGGRFRAAAHTSHAGPVGAGEDASAHRRAPGHRRGLARRERLDVRPGRRRDRGLERLRRAASRPRIPADRGDPAPAPIGWTPGCRRARPKRSPSPPSAHRRQASGMPRGPARACAGTAGSAWTSGSA